MSFGTGDPWWQKKQVRKARELEPHGRAEYWREESWGTPYSTHDILKDGELFDFNGRFHSSEGTFPKKAFARFYDEDDGTYPAKEGYTRALAMINSNSELYYEGWAFDDPGSVEFWVRPYFEYNATANDYTFISDWSASASASTLVLFYDITDDKIKMTVTGTAGTATVATSAYTSSSSLQAWIHIKAAWDSANDDYELLINGSSVATSSTDVGTWTPKTQLNIGCESKSTGVANVGGSLFCDMRWIDHFNTSADHYARNKPWFNPEELASKLTTVMIAPHGLTVNKGDITIFDQNNRQILLGSQGMKMADSNLNVVHDVADSVIASDMAYAGHVYFKEAADSILDVGIDYTDVNANRFVNGSITNTDISSVLPADVSNPRAVLIFVQTSIYLESNKVLSGTTLWTITKYALEYNTSPGNYQYVTWRGYAACVAATEVGDLVASMGIIPITWDGDTPYITTRTIANFSGMDTNFGHYVVEVRVSIMGFLA